MHLVGIISESNHKLVKNENRKILKTAKLVKFTTYTELNYCLIKIQQKLNLIQLVQ